MKKYSVADRGFVGYEGVDRYGQVFTIQESSLATEDCIWLGRADSRMHLTREMAAELVPLLQEFITHGHLPPLRGSR